MAVYSEDFVIIACTFLLWLQSMTDGQTDAQAIAKTREAFCYRT